MAEVPGQIDCPECDGGAFRVFSPPAAIHFRGGGFYETDVRQKLHRKRRKNPGDDLPVEFDVGAARIADAL